jgi:hypothetical protein
MPGESRAGIKPSSLNHQAIKSWTFGARMQDVVCSTAYAAPRMHGGDILGVREPHVPALEDCGDSSKRTFGLQQLRWNQPGENLSRQLVAVC